jgi:hypothetical protein
MAFWERLTAWFKHNDPRIHWAGSQAALIEELRGQL